MPVDSALFYLSTEHASRRSGGRFEFNIANAMYVNKVVKLVPQSITLPNIFPNVSVYNNSWTEPSGFISVSPAQYSALGISTQFTLDSTDFTFTLVGGFFQIACVGTLAMTSPTIDVFSLLGFQDQVTLAGGIYTLSVPTTLTASSLPNAGGEKLVFIVSSKMAPGNCVFGADGKLYDILTTLSLHNIDYGLEGHFRTGDVIAEDIDYKHTNQLDSFVVALLDSQFRPLDLPTNYHLRMMFKVFHGENK